MTLNLKRDGTARWRGVVIGRITKSDDGYAFDASNPNVPPMMRVSVTLRELRNNITREFVMIERYHGVTSQRDAFWR